MKIQVLKTSAYYLMHILLIFLFLAHIVLILGIVVLSGWNIWHVPSLLKIDKIMAVCGLILLWTEAGVSLGYRIFSWLAGVIGHFVFSVPDCEWPTMK